MILVVGATGDLGGMIARTLLDRGHRVRILVRSGSPHEGLLSAGAEQVPGDLKDRGSLAAACSGVDAVVTTANSMGRGGADTIESVDRAGNRDLVDAAAAAGVERFVFVSAFGAGPDHPLPFLQAKGETEQRIRDSGMAWTVLQPNGFMDKLVGPVVGGPVVSGRPVVLVGEGRRRHSLIAMRDVAAYAVAALGHPEAAGRTLLLGGPEALSWRDVVAAFERQVGREVPVQTVPMGEQVPGLPGVISQLLAAFETYDSPIDMSEPADTFGVAPTSVEDFARDFLAASRTTVG